MRRLIISILLLVSFLNSEEASVTKGEFEKKLILTGNLIASRSERFAVPKSSSWQVQIKWMPKEGTVMKQGDPVVRFDTSNMANDIETIETNIRDKREMLANKLIENRHSLLELDINQKKAQVQYDKTKLDAGIPKKLMSEYDYAQKQFELKKSTIGLNTANYEKKVKTESLKSDVETLKIELEELKAKLDKTKGMIDSHTLKAETEGPLEYGMHPWEGRKFQIGESAAISWVVAKIPDNSSLMIEVWVNETEIHNIKEGARVKLFLDAYPDREFEGAVVKIARSAEKRDEWGKIKRFEVRVKPDTLDTKIMKSGMSVRCEMMLEKRGSALLIPVEYAYFTGTYACVKTADGELVKLEKFRYNDFFMTSESSELKEGLKLIKLNEQDIKELEK